MYSNNNIQKQWVHFDERNTHSEELVTTVSFTYQQWRSWEEVIVYFNILIIIIQY
jgi:hypothetical protein